MYNIYDIINTKMSNIIKTYKIQKEKRNKIDYSKEKDFKEL